jgi:hypothetical protein
MIAAVVLGFVVEYSQVSKPVPPYHCAEVLLTLPRPVSPSVCLSWGIIIFAVMRTVQWMELPRL